MAATLSRYNGATLATPALVLEGSHDRTSESQTKLHELLSGGMAVTLRPNSAPSGTLSLLYLSRTSAESVYSAFLAGVLIVYTNDAPTRSITFTPTSTKLSQVVVGNIEAWRIEASYREVTP